MGGCDSAPVSHGSGGQSGNEAGGRSGGGGAGGQTGGAGGEAAGGGGGAAGSGGGGGAVGTGGRSPGSGGGVGSGGAGGAAGCSADTFPKGQLCSSPHDGTCWHDPLTYSCDPTTGRWVCPFDSVPAPPHACGGASGTGATAGSGGSPGAGAGGGPGGAGGRGGAGGSGPAVVWSPDATKAVIDDTGGGFTAPPPSGSECGAGVASYTFTVAAGGLLWHVCDTTQTPYKLVDGSRVLTAGERMMLVDALQAVVISTRKTCGADKSIRFLTVTRPSGPVIYHDSFYACMDQPPYVDGIDAVFSAAAKLAK